MTDIHIRVFKFKDLNARENYQKHSSVNKKVVEQLPSDIHAHFKCIMDGSSIDDIYTENGWFSDPRSFLFTQSEIEKYLDEITDFKCIMVGSSVDDIYTENGWFSDPDSFPSEEVREYLDEITDFEEQRKDEIIAELHHKVYELEEKLRKIKDIL